MAAGKISAETLQRRFGGVVLPTDVSPLSVFGDQFHRRLKAVHIQAQRPVQFAKLPMRMLPNQAIIADHLAHHDPILLFNKALIVLLSYGTSCSGVDAIGHVPRQEEDVGHLGSY